MQNSALFLLLSTVLITLPAFAAKKPEAVQIVNQPVQTEIAVTSEVRFVGFAPNSNGGEVVFGENLTGYPAMHAACAAQVPGSRACTSEEAARSVALDTAERGWVIPSNIRLLIDPVQFGGEDSRCYVSYDGATAAPLIAGFCSNSSAAHLNRIACESYTSLVGSGIAFGANGVESASCASGVLGGEEISVACCAPVTVETQPN